MRLLGQGIQAPSSNTNSGCRPWFPATLLFWSPRSCPLVQFPQIGSLSSAEWAAGIAFTQGKARLAASQHFVQDTSRLAVPVPAPSRSQAVSGPSCEILQTVQKRVDRMCQSSPPLANHHQLMLVCHFPDPFNGFASCMRVHPH